MPKRIDALSDLKVRNTKPGDKKLKLFDGYGLYLLVNPDGSKGWRFKYRHRGREKLISLGRYPEVSLRQAREQREEARRLIAAGQDPSAVRQAAAKVAAEASRREHDTFEGVSAQWFARYSSIWAVSHAETITARLRNDVLPWLASRRVGEITAVEVLELLRRVEQRGALETAHRIKGIIGQVLRFAVATGRATRDVTADLRGALPPVREKHHAALTRQHDIAGLLRAINDYRGSFVVRCALRLAPLLFVRPGELRRAEWAEFELDASQPIWKIPATKMKAGQEHWVPLSQQAVAILKELHPLTGHAKFAFPSSRTDTRPMSEVAVLAALRRMGFGKDEQTGHGFRTLASTALHEAGWPSDVIELQLAHVTHRNSVRAAYDRSERLVERREMMTWWADHLGRLAAGGELIPPRQVNA